jgi:hypothetical protein
MVCVGRVFDDLSDLARSEIAVFRPVPDELGVGECLSHTDEVVALGVLDEIVSQWVQRASSASMAVVATTVWTVRLSVSVGSVIVTPLVQSVPV